MSRSGDHSAGGYLRRNRDLVAHHQIDARARPTSPSIVVAPGHAGSAEAEAECRRPLYPVLIVHPTGALHVIILAKTVVDRVDAQAVLQAQRVRAALADSPVLLTSEPKAEIRERESVVDGMVARVQNATADDRRITDRRAPRRTVHRLEDGLEGERRAFIRPRRAHSNVEGVGRSGIVRDSLNAIVRNRRMPEVVERPQQRDSPPVVDLLGILRVRTPDGRLVDALVRPRRRLTTRLIPRCDGVVHVLAYVRAIRQQDGVESPLAP